MSKWATPENFVSDGCTWPSLDWVLGKKRYKKICRRHDFECRYSIYSWASARDYFIKGCRLITPPLLMWRIPVFYVGLWIFRRRCKWTSPEPMNPEWTEYIDRNYYVQ